MWVVGLGSPSWAVIRVDIRVALSWVRLSPSLGHWEGCWLWGKLE